LEGLAAAIRTIRVADFLAEMAADQDRRLLETEFASLASGLKLGDSRECGFNSVGFWQIHGAGDAPIRTRSAFIAKHSLRGAITNHYWQLVPPIYARQKRIAVAHLLGS
jgi:hypothetical protein